VKFLTPPNECAVILCAVCDAVLIQFLNYRFVGAALETEYPRGHAHSVLPLAAFANPGALMKQKYIR
jgi:hypothetical protein